MFLFIFMLSWTIWNDQSRVVYSSLAVHLVKAGPVLQYHTYTGVFWAQNFHTEKISVIFMTVPGIPKGSTHD